MLKVPAIYEYTICICTAALIVHNMYYECSSTYTWYVHIMYHDISSTVIMHKIKISREDLEI